LKLISLLAGVVLVCLRNTIHWIQLMYWIRVCKLTTL